MIRVSPEGPAERTPPSQTLNRRAGSVPVPMGDQDLSNELEGQGYQLTGRHSAVKLCYWTRQSLVNGRDG